MKMLFDLLTRKKISHTVSYFVTTVSCYNLPLICSYEPEPGKNSAPLSLSLAYRRLRPRCPDRVKTSGRCDNLIGWNL